MEKIGTQKIETKRLTLRPFKKEDKNQIYKNYGNDKKTHKYISWIPCNTIEKCEKFIEYNLNKYKENPLHFSWTISYHNQVIGSIAIFNVDENNDSGELGYSLGSKWWKQGFMSEATKAVLDYAFNQVKFNRIYASCHEENIASKKVMEKLSMSYEGKLREGQKNTDNTYSNLDLYSILKKEYKKR